MLAISSLPWQETPVSVALVSLLAFLPLVWVRAELPTRGASLLLTLWAPALLFIALVGFLPMYYALYLDHFHLQNELGGFIVTLVPAVTVLGAWILGLVDILRRRAWGWLAPVALLPFLGTLVYGFASRRKGPEGQGRQAAMGAGALQLAGATLALLAVLMAIIVVVAGLDFRGGSMAELFALFGAGVAVLVGVDGGLALLRGQRTLAALVLVLAAVLAAQVIAGTSFPVQDVSAPGWAPSVVLSVFGIPASEAAGLRTTLGLTAALAAVELTCAVELTRRAQR